MSSLSITSTWDSQAPAAADEIEATLCKLTIAIGKSVVTEYRDGGRLTTRHLHTPAYFIAEWLAENWWAILHEPRKDEEGDDGDFPTRHSLLSAQHGFALPALEIVPVGKAIHVSTTRHRDRLANAEFDTVSVLDVSRDEIRPVLATFVDECVKQLARRAVAGTPLEDAWRRIRETSLEEEVFCELVGSLGLSPYNVQPITADAIDRLENSLGVRATRDFCLAVNEDQLLKTVSAVDCISKWMEIGEGATLAPLSQMTLPSDNLRIPSWRRGINAARSVMSEFNVSYSDPRGADRVFDKFHIDPSKTVSLFPGNGAGDLPFSAAVQRNDDAAKVALLQNEEPRRRFAAARAMYLAWASEKQSTRLATNAITRDQQASRQFAAEILVPRKCLDAQSKDGRLYAHVAYEIARARRASPEVVYLQARNAGIQIISM
jgi:hypothetical protein